MPFDWSIMSDEDRAALDELKRRVDELNGTLPPPSDEEFYSKLWSLYAEYKPQGLSYADIAEKLGVSLNTLKRRMSAWSRKHLAHPGKTSEGSSDIDLPAYLQSVLSRQIAKYFGRNIDALTRETITEIIQTGAKIYEQYGSWLKENVNPNLVEAAAECIEFYRKHHDKIDQLEARIRRLEQEKKVLMALVKPKVASLILFDLATQGIVNVLTSGVGRAKLKPLYSLAMYAARNLMEVQPR